MRTALRMYIGGAWVDPVEPRRMDVVNPATEQPAGRVAVGSAADVDRAVIAARLASASYGRSTRQERIEVLEARARRSSRAVRAGRTVWPAAFTSGRRSFLGAKPLAVAPGEQPEPTTALA